MVFQHFGPWPVAWHPPASASRVMLMALLENLTLIFLWFSYTLVLVSSLAPSAGLRRPTLLFLWFSYTLGLGEWPGTLRRPPLAE